MIFFGPLTAARHEHFEGVTAQEKRMGNSATAKQHVFMVQTTVSRAWHAASVVQQHVFWQTLFHGLSILHRLFQGTTKYGDECFFFREIMRARALF